VGDWEPDRARAKVLLMTAAVGPGGVIAVGGSAATSSSAATGGNSLRARARGIDRHGRTGLHRDGTSSASGTPEWHRHPGAVGLSCDLGRMFPGRDMLRIARSRTASSAVAEQPPTSARTVRYRGRA